MLDDYETALEPLRRVLAADGYLLDIETTSVADADLTLTVRAGPDACEECLVPLDVFAAIATKRFEESGLAPTLTVVYPTQRARE